MWIGKRGQWIKEMDGLEEEGGRAGDLVFLEGIPNRTQKMVISSFQVRTKMWITAGEKPCMRFSPYELANGKKHDKRLKNHFYINITDIMRS